MSPQKLAISQAFSNAANVYENFAFVEQEIGERLLQRLALIKIQPRYILDLGCGTGYFTSKLQQAFPDAVIVGLDIAFGMLNFATRFTQKLYCCGDAEQLPFTASQFDLIFINCCLPSISNPNIIFTEVQRVLALNGLCLFSTWGPDTLQEFGIELNTHDMHQLGDLLLQQNFKDPVVDTEKLTFTYNKLQTLLEDLHYSGNFLIDFTAIKNSNEPCCTATFEVIYGHAYKQKYTRQYTDAKGNIYIPLTDLKIL